MRSDPAVYSASVITDLELFAPDVFHEMQVFGTPYLAEHYVSW